MKWRLWGPLAPLGLVMAVLIFGSDQAHKWWMLHVYDINARQPVNLTPFFDLVLVWNRGISYGLFQSGTQHLLIALSLIISGILWVWLCRAATPLTAAAVGMIIGGALGNTVDRLIYGAVADFFHLYWNGWSWYVFNVADMAIVAGVGLLLYESFLERGGRQGLRNA